jgi:hypothetical protein
MSKISDNVSEGSYQHHLSQHQQNADGSGAIGQSGIKKKQNVDKFRNTKQGSLNGGGEDMTVGKKAQQFHSDAEEASMTGLGGGNLKQQALPPIF